MKFLNCVFYLLFAAVSPLQAQNGDTRGISPVQWEEYRPRERYSSLSEERFQMKCDYLGIKGRKRDSARVLFERCEQRRRELLERRRDGGFESDSLALGFYRLDLQYLRQIEPLTPKKAKPRIERMINRLQARILTRGSDGS